MRIQVEHTKDDRGELLPKRVIIGTSSFAVKEVVDRWPGGDHEYFKLRGPDDALYILRHELANDTWELTAYLAPDASELLAGLDLSPRGPKS
jgi:hypothetical protein